MPERVRITTERRREMLTNDLLGVIHEWHMDRVFSEETIRRAVHVVLNRKEPPTEKQIHEREVRRKASEKYRRKKKGRG